MDRGAADDGSIDDIPWARVFDPVANARALSAIQARGFSAAAQLVDRFLQGGETPTDSAGSARGTTAADGDVELLMNTWWAMFGRLLRSMPGAAAPLRGDGASFDLAGESASGGVHLAADGPGLAAGEVWLHNRGADEIGSVALRCGDLLAHDGAKIGSGAVQFTPDTLALPGRSSRGIAVAVKVTPEVAPGRYRGTLLAQGYPDLWLPLTLTLRAPLE